MKRLVLLTAVLILSQLACQLGSPAPEPTAQPTPEPLPTWTPQPTRTPPPGPEDINSGTHTYWRETIEAGCSAAEESRGAEYVEKTHSFAPDLSTATYADRIYDRIGLHRYQSINQDNKPLVLIYTDFGFDLEVYNEGENPDTTPACLIFRFRLDK